MRHALREHEYDDHRAYGYGGEHSLLSEHLPVSHHRRSYGHHVADEVRHGNHDYAVHYPAHKGKRYSEEGHHEGGHFEEGHELVDGHHLEWRTEHPELDHKYDDQHDIEPKHFHEHAVLHSLPHPES